MAERIRKTVLNTGIRFDITDKLGFDNASLSMYQDVQSRGLETDEHEFTDLVKDSMIAEYSWKDKYLPRKPRFFNSVKTGYEWNKYN
mmetsp:Transcript_41934/g.30196  ORF Transcript_41934/g.30196 Transcript_41934/m.30196 type:complete len:87 (+) Transcript_41934:1324-1584(+)|eukprot:CAMPEP_0116873906 /NCGR_PEP_ID=MMETSP0463-20121206/5242_1 /TAXON_ID=181622 /ORGANISM="Strombidinopsis sp, Strain SopsisLIS2011" /LENGTH=86 /DNA_ID=CAMNT_0004516767 /DNA_START=1239 /DNA_END=1499 /DNA_ORIENTATION=+